PPPGLVPPLAARPDPFASLEHVSTGQAETFVQLVRKRFRKNRPAVASLWIIAFLFLISFPGALLFVSPDLSTIPNDDGKPHAPGAVDIANVGDDKAFADKLALYRKEHTTPISLGL